MTTARDLLITAMDVDPDRSVGQGDLSLALAGAEVIDLLAADAVHLDGDRLVASPGADDGGPPPGRGGVLTRTSGALRAGRGLAVAQGRGLAAVHLAALEADGQLTRQRQRRLLFGAVRMVVVDSPARRRALHRWAADEPVLVSLAAAVGIPAEQGVDVPVVTDDAVTTVLAAVNDAVMELEAVRQRRSIENAAFANLWRGA